MDKSGIYARDSLSLISLILSYNPKIPAFRKYVTFDLIGGKNKSFMTSRICLEGSPSDGEGRECVTASDLERLRIRLEFSQQIP